MTIEERESRFMSVHIGDRTRESLAKELFGIYLVIRANSFIDELQINDPWPDKAHLADVLEKHVIKPMFEGKDH